MSPKENFRRNVQLVESIFRPQLVSTNTFKKLYCGENDLIDLVRIRLVNVGSSGFLKIVSLVKLSPLKLQKSTNRVMK